MKNEKKIIKIHKIKFVEYLVECLITILFWNENRARKKN